MWLRPRSVAGDGRARAELALDHNFPLPILACLDDYLVDIRLVSLRHIDPRLSEVSDRQLLLALHQLGWAGLVTNDYRMLRNPADLAALLRTHLTVFAIEGVGDDPLRATGAVLLDLPGAIGRMLPGRAQVFWLRPRHPPPQDPWALMQQAAKRQGRPASDLYDEVKVSDDELARSVLT